MGRKLNEEQTIGQLGEWLAPNTVHTSREPATDRLRVMVRRPDGSLVIEKPYAIDLPVDEVDLEIHANNLREAAGMADLLPTQHMVTIRKPRVASVRAA